MCNFPIQKPLKSISLAQNLETTITVMENTFWSRYKSQSIPLSVGSSKFFLYFCHKVDNLVFFQNKEIFVQLDELDKLDRITQA